MYCIYIVCALLVMRINTSFINVLCMLCFACGTCQDVHVFFSCHCRGCLLFFRVVEPTVFKTLHKKLQELDPEEQRGHHPRALLPSAGIG